MMIPLDPSHKPTSQHRIAEGDTVVVYERHDVMHVVTVAADLVLQNRFGSFTTPTGSATTSDPRSSSAAASGKCGRKAGGGFVHLLDPTPELWMLLLSHRT
jgi:tRNA (adenine57-N1/adenine58-N1)-methyltransferase